ncbi:MAG: 4Fe-4S ferredoxin iron-sulfur binding domain protein [Desulfomicrobiaceae bacterium]|nr:4Fe-4S ferredoxin iron-sulfur binding domain protein [Desulfomicrobiaceae bacterium]MBZ4684464.1 4Fe-4S ferredoxin iron-sulfur binding domain protein [Desulfomicrobiaceae bacterium]MDI3492287.1 2-oxoglutarate ferredoxin oxidoreductase subunit delta [Desulfomicrobiaceae bacterium]
MAGKRGRGRTRVRIYPDWCKGCGICVAFCPAGVFAMGPQGKAVVAKEALCMDCGFCELHCPDFAVSVTPRPEGALKGAEASKETEHAGHEAHKEPEHGEQETQS